MALLPARSIRSSSVSRLRSSIQAVCGSVIVPMVLRVIRTGRIAAFDAQHAAGDEVAVPADILGQAVDDEVGTLAQRLCPQRPEEGVVDDDRRQLAAIAENGGAGIAHRLDVDQRVGRVRRALEIDRRDPPLRLGPGDDRLDLRLRRAGGEIEEGHAHSAPRMRAISVSVAA